MRPEVQKLLTPFYFGAISEADRLRIEQELLIDSEVLVDYLDLKRQIEAAPEIPPEPSPALWRRLKAEIKPRRKLIFTLSFAAGLAAASLFIAMMFFSKPQSEPKASGGGGQQVLFDSSGEPSSGSNVL
jgi:hypothetical protein